MFPIRDHNPSGRTPWVTWALIVINVVVFLATWPLFSDPPALQQFFFDWGLVPRALSRGGDWGGLVTSMFLHGGVMHLAGNMLFLFIFGDNLEDAFGRLGYLAFYLLAGIGAGLAHVLSDPGSLVPTVGASGAIAGVMGGYLLLFPRARIDILVILVVFIRVIALPAWIMLGLWFGFQLLAGAASGAAGAGVAYWAHSGGFVIGLVLAVPAWLRRGGPAWWRRNQGHPPHPGARPRQTRIPVAGRRRQTRVGPWNR